MTIKDTRGFVYSENLEVKLIKEVPWKVGPYKKQKISRGARIHISLPILSNDDFKLLTAKFGANAWLIKLKRRMSQNAGTMGYFSARFSSKKSNNNIRIIKSKTASLGVNYWASSISTRLDNIPCPALGHRKKIESIKVIEDQKSDKQLFVISSSEKEKIRAKVHGIAFSPETVNGGKELSGEYHVDVALYNIDTKEKLSSYVSINNYGKIAQEREVVISGCKGYVIPKRSEDNDSAIKNFKFKR